MRQYLNIILKLFLCCCFCTGSLFSQTSVSFFQREYAQLIRLIGQKEYGQALEKGCNLLWQSPDETRIFERILNAGRAANQMEEVFSIFQKMTEGSTADVRGYYGLGLWYEKTNDLSAAFASYQRCLVAKPEYRPAQVKFAEVAGKLKMADEAESFLQKLFADRMEIPAAHFAFGCLWSTSGKTTEAIHAFDLVTATNSQRTDACYQKAETLYRVENFDESLRTSRTCGAKLQIANDWKFMFRRLEIMNLLRLGKNEEAFELSQQLHQLGLETSDDEMLETALNLLGIVELVKGRLASAQTYFQQSVDIAATRNRLDEAGRTLGNLGTVHYLLGNYPEALRRFEGALQASRKARDIANLIAILYRQGELFTLLDQTNEAINCYQQLMAENINNNNSNFKLTYQALAKLHLKTGNYYRAESAINEGLQAVRDSGYGDLELTLQLLQGELYLKTKRLPEAAGVFQEVIRWGTDKGWVLYDWLAYDGLARSLAGQGQYEKARDTYVQAIRAIERSRADAGREAQKIGFFQSKASVYEGMIGLLMKIGWAEGVRKYQAEAFDFAERARARALLDKLHEFPIQQGEFRQRPSRFVTYSTQEPLNLVQVQQLLKQK